MNHRRGALFFCLFAAVASGCGGTDNGRTVTQVDEPVAYDVGSRPVLCSVVDGYEFKTIQDFELGSVTGGWYFNNDQCDKCQKVIDRIKEINGIVNPVQLEMSTEPVYPDKYGCSDWRLKKRNTEADDEYQARIAPIQLAYQAELDVLQQQLIEGDPDNNVPANCRDACKASQFPDAYIKPLAASRMEFTLDGKKFKEQPRCGSHFAMHVESLLPFQTWGGVFAVQLGNPGLDATGWDGISFWARVGPSSRHPLRIEISDQRNDDKQMMYTFPGETALTPVTRESLIERNDQGEIEYDYFDTPGDEQSWCNKRLFSCNPDSVREDRNGCDKYGANRSMSGDWQFFTIDFSVMRQSGWGMAVTEPPMDPKGLPAELDKSQLRSLNFLWTTGTWDVWIDDIALYRRKQP